MLEELWCINRNVCGANGVHNLSRIWTGKECCIVGISFTFGSQLCVDVHYLWNGAYSLLAIFQKTFNINHLCVYPQSWGSPMQPDILLVFAFWIIWIYVHVVLKKRCVLYEGCVFLCTDREAPELPVFAISWEPEEPTTEGTHTHTHTLLPVCKLCLLQEAIMLACFLRSGGFSQGNVAAMSRSAAQNRKHNRAENFRTSTTEPLEWIPTQRSRKHLKKEFQVNAFVNHIGQRYSKRKQNKIVLINRNV